MWSSNQILRCFKFSHYASGLNCCFVQFSSTGLVKSVNKHEYVQMMNMSVAQILMGLYLTGLVLTDNIMAGHFNSIILWWQKHWLCQTLATISFLSLSVTISTLTYTSLCRAYTFMSFGYKVDKSLSAKVCLAIWAMYCIYVGFL